MLQFRDEYYDDEVRDGFYVSPVMKHCWAAQLEVINVVIEVCKKNNIKYFACAGTFLGAIRHGGYIPWDDDIDICMLRSDYMKFLEIAESELPEEYYIRNMHEVPEYRSFFMRICSSKTDGIRCDDDFLQKNHGFYGIAGIDVFPLDFVPQDESIRSVLHEEIDCLVEIAKEYDFAGLTGRVAENLRIAEHKYNISVSREGNIGQNILKCIEKQLCDVKGSLDGDICIIYDWVQNASAKFPGRPYAHTVEVTFENISISVPYQYDAALKAFFNDYMRVSKRGSTHLYPWFKGQLETLGYKDYVFDESILPAQNRRENWVSYKRNQINECMELFAKAKNLAELKLGEGDIDTARTLLVKCEEMANNASMIEGQIKGNGRRRVVFFAWKPEHWNSIANLYEMECGKEDTDVYVIPVPYYRYDEMGNPGELIVNIEGFPEDVSVVPYDKFDYEEQRIDRAYYQNPYDEENRATNVLPFFYISNLHKYVDRLIYKPWFELDEFDADDSRSMFMMKYHAYMPGVVAADKVIMQGEWLRNHYVRELTKWAGINTKNIWEEKITTFDAFVSEQFTERSIENIENVPGDKADQKDKRVLLYHIGLGQILSNPTGMIEKMECNYEIFSKASANITVALDIDGFIEKYLREFFPERLGRYTDILSRYSTAPWCEMFDGENENSSEDVSDKYDAFYGDAGILMKDFARMSKPVMIQDYS